MLRSRILLCQTRSSVRRVILSVALASWLALPPASASQASSGSSREEPAGQTLRLYYRAEWRGFHAGNVVVDFQPAPAPDSWGQAQIFLQTVGFVDALYHVENLYQVRFSPSYCLQSVLYRVEERGKRRRIEILADNHQHKIRYQEVDLKTNKPVETKEIDVPACVYDEISGLAWLRTTRLEPGQSLEVDVTNGKKATRARVDALRRERIKTPAGLYDAIRYEAHLFNDVLHRRKGRLFVWLTDDERRLPVQIQVQLRFYIGTVTVQLVKEELL